MHFNPKLPIILSTDASNNAIAGVLSHQFDNGLRPIAFISRALSKSERNYSAIEKEALAIIFSVTKLKQYLLGIHFFLQTDHKPLLSIFGEGRGLPIMAAARVQRWALILSGFDYTIKYVNGTFNDADGFSRMPQIEYKNCGNLEGCNYINYIEINSCLNLCYKDIAKETRLDPLLAKLCKAIHKGVVVNLKGDQFDAFRSKSLELTVEGDCILWG